MGMPVVEVLGTLVIGVLSLLLTLPGSQEAWGRVRHALKSRRQTECELALKLAESTGDPDIKRHAEELGVAALVGDRHLSHGQRKQLLSIPGSEKVIELYMQSRKLVKVVDSREVLAWKSDRFSKRWYRRTVRAGWAIAYFASALSVLAPSLVWKLFYAHQATSGLVLGLQAFTALTMVPLAMLCLYNGSLVSGAERLLTLAGDGLSLSRAPGNEAPLASPLSEQTSVDCAEGIESARRTDVSGSPMTQPMAALDAKTRVKQRSRPHKPR